MKSHIVLGLFAAVSITLGARANGALKFERTAVPLAVHPGEKSLTTSFAFTNAAKTSVKITDVHTSCGCTVADADRRSYAPGETGKIAATFTVGTAEGAVTRLVTVVTDEPAPNTYDLRLDIDIPRLLLIEPEFLAWSWKERDTPKMLTLRGQPGSKVEVLNTDVPAKRFATTTKLADSSTTITVSPTADVTTGRDELKLDVQVDGVSARRTVLLRILPSPAEVDPLPVPVIAKTTAAGH